MEETQGYRCLKWDRYERYEVQMTPHISIEAGVLRNGQVAHLLRVWRWSRLGGESQLALVDRTSVPHLGHIRGIKYLTLTRCLGKQGNTDRR